MSPIDEFAIDRAPDLRPAWATPMEWIFTLVNVLALISNAVGSFFWFKWMMAPVPAGAVIPLVISLNGWYCWSHTVNFIRFYPRWRYASQVYAETWVKERIREFRRAHGSDGEYFGLFLSVVPWGYFLYLQLKYDLPVWTWLFWVLFVLWAPVQGRYLARIHRLSTFVLTTEAPSSRSRFAPRRDG